MEWLFELGFGDKFWILCYRGIKDGWLNINFYSRCDSRGFIIILGRKNCFIFGGFLDYNWMG